MPCGYCAACLSNKRNEWTFRLQQEQKVSSTAKFITLTYAEDTVPVSEYGELELSKRDIQLFFKKLRHAQNKYSENQIRYYMVGEYGENTDRPHYHVLLFNADSKILEVQPKKSSKLEEIWKNGHLDIGTCTLASIHYVTGYVITRQKEKFRRFFVEEENTRQLPFALMSRRPAIGHQYIAANKGYHQKNQRFYVRSPNGTKQKIPQYYNNKTFTDEERKANAISSMERIAETYRKKNIKQTKMGMDPYTYLEEQENNFTKKQLKKDKSKKL